MEMVAVKQNFPAKNVYWKFSSPSKFAARTADPCEFDAERKAPALLKMNSTPINRKV